MFLSTHSSGNPTALISLFNFFIKQMSNTFLNVLPIAIKSLISLLLVSVISFTCIFVFCFTVGVIYHFISLFFNTVQAETIVIKLKKSVKFVIDKINQPHEDGDWIKIVHKILPIVAIVGLLTPFWLASLPLLAISLVSNPYISKKLNFKIDIWIYVFFILMSFIALQLLEYSS